MRRKIHLRRGRRGIENYIAFQSFSGSRSPTLSNSELKGRVMNCGEDGRGKLRYEYKPKSTIYHRLRFHHVPTLLQKIPECFRAWNYWPGREISKWKSCGALPGGSAVFNDIRIKIQQGGVRFDVEHPRTSENLWQTETGIFRNGIPLGQKFLQFRRWRINDSVGSSRVRLSAD